MDIAIGITLIASHENLQIELWVPNNSITYNFGIWGALVTHLWTKSLWKKSDAFVIDIRLIYKVSRSLGSRIYV